MDTSKIVGEKIKSLRESQSISMEELAQRSGLAIEQIERIENNIDLPSLAPLIKIARVLACVSERSLTIRMKTVLWYAVSRKQRTASVSPTMPSTHASTWSTIPCPSQRPIATWNRSSLTWHLRTTAISCSPHTKAKSSSWSWKELWKSATEEHLPS